MKYLYIKCVCVYICILFLIPLKIFLVRDEGHIKVDIYFTSQECVGFNNFMLVDTVSTLMNKGLNLPDALIQRDLQVSYKTTKKADRRPEGQDRILKRHEKTCL